MCPQAAVQLCQLGKERAELGEVRVGRVHVDGGGRPHRVLVGPSIRHSRRSRRLYAPLARAELGRRLDAVRVQSQEGGGRLGVLPVRCRALERERLPLGVAQGLAGAAACTWALLRPEARALAADHPGRVEMTARLQPLVVLLQHVLPAVGAAVQLVEPSLVV